MNRAYNHYFFHYTATPLLVVNTADVDFATQRRGHSTTCCKQIRGMGKGTQYYVPRGSRPEPPLATGAPAPHARRPDPAARSLDERRGAAPSSSRPVPA